MDEPYTWLTPEARLHAIVVFRRWARRQLNPFRPFTEVVGGSRFTPLDLLLEFPPVGLGEREFLAHKDRGAWSHRAASPTFLRVVRGLRGALGFGKPEVWHCLLNLVAVQAEYRREDVRELLKPFESVAERRDIDWGVGA